MSWSVTLVGLPGKIVTELDRYEGTLSGQSQAEFAEAKPHLQALVQGNIGQSGLLQLDANGHATIANETKTYGSVNVSLKSFSGVICV